jgi:glutathione synthase/RimK-type ligase-like ATP-grasp enzyme
MIGQRGNGRRIGLVTFEDLPDLTPDDRLASAALTARGHDVQPLVWSEPSITWASFDALVLRSCWDYHRRPDAFRAWLAAREREGALLHNSVALARWNVDKRYLRDLEGRGVLTARTVWLEPGDPPSLAELRRSTGWTDLVVKPAVSATAWRLHRLRPDHQTWPPELATAMATDAFLVQPFLTEIGDGEWSLVFFDGGFSHAVLKRPRPGDFRVQGEYGGRATAEVASPALIEQARRILDLLPERPLYARVDGVQTASGFLLLELELLEPALFFAADSAAADRFADALEARLQSKSERPPATD